MHIPMTPEQMQQVLDFGTAAEELMQSPSFHSVIDALSHYHLSALVAAPIGDVGKEARDHHHTMHTAIREIATEITARVDAAQALSKQIDDQDEEDTIQ